MSEENTLTSYSGVTLTPEEVSSLDDSPTTLPADQNLGEAQPQESVSHENDQSELPETEQDNDHLYEDVLEYGGEEYNMQTVQEAIEAFNNKADWQKSNTEKSQEISAERKSLEAEQQLWMGLRNDEDAIAALKDVLDEDHPIFSDGIAVEGPYQDTKDSTNDRIQELEEKLNELREDRERDVVQVEADRQVTNDLNELKQNHPELDDPEVMDQVIKMAIDKGFTGLTGLEDAYALTYHSAADESAFKTAVNRARNAKAMKSVPEPEGAVRGLHEEPNVVPTSYKDAKADAIRSYNFYE